MKIIKNMECAKSNIAVLIDGDNAQPKLIKEILEEVSKHGNAVIRRIYGDWTTPQMNAWKHVVNEYSVSPIQKFSYTTGKNSTDTAMIIDAMDILYSKRIDGFCIVSSDSDYTGLAKRIREEGLFVMGIGEMKTPNAFIQSCEIFTFTENLMDDNYDEPESGETKNNAPKQAPTPPNSNLKKLIPIQIIDKAFEISAKDDDEAFISTVGTNLHKIDPSFDPRTYGFSNLTKLFESIKTYEVVKNMVDGLNHPLVKQR